MNTRKITPADLRASVIAVPPLGRSADLTINEDSNRALIKYLKSGGVTSYLYGGNANFYNIGLYEYESVLDHLLSWFDDNSLVIPSAGPDFGKLMDQATILRRYEFPTVMALPLTFPATQSGTMTAIRRFAERVARPIVLYLKSENVLSPAQATTLIDEHIVSFVKYAIVRKDAENDQYLTELLTMSDKMLVVSGMGERPAPAHLQKFGLSTFTSGSVCVAPAASMALLRALQANNRPRIEKLWREFIPLEDQRDAISPIRVLHDAVGLAGIADLGPILPQLSNLEPENCTAIEAAARQLFAANSVAMKSAA